MVQGISGEFNKDSYGNILRAGTLPNGRTLYRVIDSNGKEAGRLSIPNEQRDVFEKSYSDIIESAPKIQQYAREHSSDKERKKRLNRFRAIITSGGIIGALIPLHVLRNSQSAPKQIVSSVCGTLAGMFAGYGTALVIDSPPGTLKFAKASYQLSKMDVQPVKQFIA